jgi:hypothetical protein
MARRSPASMPTLAASERAARSTQKSGLVTSGLPVWNEFRRLNGTGPDYRDEMEAGARRGLLRHVLIASCATGARRRWRDHPDGPAFPRQQGVRRCSLVCAQLRAAAYVVGRPERSPVFATCGARPVVRPLGHRDHRPGVARFHECREGATSIYRADPETRKLRKQVSACCAAQTCNARN